jgi:hypothetical protein
MKKLHTFLTFIYVCTLTNIFIAQTTHNVLVASNQPEKLVIHIGDTLFSTEGNLFSLGAFPVAEGGTEDYTYLWTPDVYLDNNSIANPQVTISTDSIVYTLLVTDANNCTASDSTLVYPITTSDVSILVNGAEHTISIMPNPASEQLTLKSTVSWDEIQIINVNGQVVFENKNKSNFQELTIKNWEQGLYYVHIISQNKSISHPIIIKH